MRCRIRLAVVCAVLIVQSVAVAQGTAEAFVAKIPGKSMISSVNVAMSDGTAGSGQTVELPINLTSIGTAVPAAFQVDLNFDPTKLTFSSARAGAQLISGNKSLSSNLVANGDVRLVTSGMNQTAIANGLVAYASFTLNTQFLTGGTAVSMANCTSASAQGSTLSTACTGATIKVFSCDINGDGSTNVLDLQLLIDEVLGVMPAVHDLNHDGAVNVADVQKLINAVLGMGCPY